MVRRRKTQSQTGLESANQELPEFQSKSSAWLRPRKVVLRHLSVRYSLVRFGEFTGFIGSPKLCSLWLIDKLNGQTPGKLKVEWLLHSVCQIKLRIRCFNEPLV
jgi:hypothetical protein